jgi:hypothetical protein
VKVACGGRSGRRFRIISFLIFQKTFLQIMPRAPPPPMRPDRKIVLKNHLQKNLGKLFKGFSGVPGKKK